MRVWWGARSGRCELDTPWGAISRESVVLISVSEFAGELGREPLMELERFIGDASIRVENITPYGPPVDSDRGVKYVVNVDGDEDLQFVVDITVLDDPPEVQRAEGSDF
jgi:hypothetical protein